MAGYVGGFSTETVGTLRFHVIGPVEFLDVLYDGPSVEGLDDGAYVGVLGDVFVEDPLKATGVQVIQESPSRELVGRLRAAGLAADFAGYREDEYLPGVGWGHMQSFALDDRSGVKVWKSSTPEAALAAAIGAGATWPPAQDARLVYCHDRYVLLSYEGFMRPDTEQVLASVVGEPVARVP